MKTLLTLLLAALAFATVAQPQKINYQAIALGSNGKPLKNTAVSLRLSILDSAATGTVLYTETQPATTDAGGQFSVYLGTGTPTAGTFASLPWANGNDKFLKVEMDAQGGTNYQTMGTTQLVSVPYAMAAKVAKELELGTIVRGNAGRTWQLTETVNGPAWTCYPPAIQANAGADQLNVCSNTVTLSGNTASGMTPAWSVFTGTGGNVNGNTFTGTRGNVYSLRYTLTNACGTTADTLQISLALPTTIATAGSDQLSLTGTTAILAANAPAAGQTGTWTITTGSGATLSNANSPTATITKGADSSYTLVWTITGPCGTSRDTVNLRFPAPVGTACGQAVSYAGESYPTVQIGTQCWFAKNLNVGTMINSSASVDSQTNNGVIEKYCYNNDPANCTTYGGLYQWAEAVQYQNGASNTTSPNPAITGNVRGICPNGWHLPSDAEYCTLTTFLDATVNCTVFSNWIGTDAGGKMKSVSGLWTSPNNGATNSSGFSALPGGSRSTFSSFYTLGSNTYFWSSSESSSSTAIDCHLNHYDPKINRSNFPKNLGLSARCTQD
jgi:uncharacterized protein (TIGR02145 family)